MSTIICREQVFVGYQNTLFVRAFDKISFLLENYFFTLVVIGIGVYACYLLWQATNQPKQRVPILIRFALAIVAFSIFVSLLLGGVPSHCPTEYVSAEELVERIDTEERALRHFTLNAQSAINLTQLRADVHCLLCPEHLVLENNVVRVTQETTIGLHKCNNEITLFPYEDNLAVHELFVEQDKDLLRCEGSF